MAPDKIQSPDSIPASLWTTLKEFYATDFLTLPSIETTLLSIHQWLQTYFPSHPKFNVALDAINMLDSAPSSAYDRRNNIDPDEILRLTWFLISSRPSLFQFF